MAEEKKEPTPPVQKDNEQPAQPTPKADEPAAQPTPKADEPAGLENDDVSKQGTPGNPKSAREVVESGDGGADTAGIDRKIKTLQDLIDNLEPLETAEQRRKRERREKSARIVSAIGDGIRAMSNLFFTTQWAPNSYNHETGSILTARNAAIERARKLRDENRDAHTRYSLAIGDAGQERAKTVREWQAEQERRKLAREKAERAVEKHRWEEALQDDKKREQTGKADKAESEAKSAKAEADNAPALQQAKLATEEARAGSYNASAANSRASAAAHGRANRQVDHHFNGKTYPKGSNDYEKDVREAARLYNERHGKWVENTKSDGSKEVKWVYDEGFRPIEIDREERTAYDRKIVPRKAEEYAGEVETRLAEERDDTPPSRRNNEDTTPPSRR